VVPHAPYLADSPVSCSSVPREHPEGFFSNLLGFLLKAREPETIGGGLLG